MSQATNHGWKRPESIPFPSIWSKFEGRKEIDGVVPKFWIQDIPENQYETVINYMVDEFLDDEPLCKYSNLSHDEESVKDMRKIWNEILKDKVGLICYMENPDPNEQPLIAAMNCTHVVLKSDKDSRMPSNGVKTAKLLDTLEFLANLKDVFAELKVDKYLNAMGLYVLPKFRGQGLGLELLKAREPLCKAVGIKATVTAFTATVSQILATRVGFKEFAVITYADMEKSNPKLKYPGVEKHTKAVKYMYILF